MLQHDSNLDTQIPHSGDLTVRGLKRAPQGAGRMIHSPPGRPAPHQTSGPRQWPRTGKVEVRLAAGGLAGFVDPAFADRILTDQKGIRRNNRRKTYIQLNPGITLKTPEYQMLNLPGPRSHGGWQQHTKAAANAASAAMRSMQTKVEGKTEHIERVEIVEHIKYGNLPFTDSAL
jgi:hypothetical protein